jgi:hypothetical protein
MSLLFSGVEGFEVLLPFFVCLFFCLFSIPEKVGFFFSHTPNI